ncbi:hypothetical protein LC605_15935 [Nostoc sp. CHAB 5836]|uniref:hypothetical protein n=1 Tax=Nostoc sp. CHAB 5836 TaxID=2780404 RepID=UPI001E3BB4E9|nr:hypothetical protein [Nostoc sp. CHAB 5836]MCC5616535.1 hypothetical protein [Nostoc sp. CHAB 5836]
MEWTRLNFIDNDFHLLFKSDIPAIKHQKIRTYHLELLQELSGMPVWPPDEVAEVLYNNFPIHYQKVVQLLGVKCDAVRGASGRVGGLCQRLTHESRHLLLVCTAPVGEGESLRPGLSHF